MATARGVRGGQTGAVSLPSSPPDSAEIRRAFFDVLDAFRALAATSEVATAWTKASALEGYDVGSLVGHVVSATGALERYLDGDPATSAPITAARYYASLPAPADAAELHRQVRERGQAIGREGPAEVLDRLDALARRLRDRLEREAPTRLIAVLGGVAIEIDQYVLTRIVELVVHGDDVAASVGLEFSPPAAAARLAVETLVAVALEGHGATAVLRALTRRERDAGNALRVF